VDVGEVHELPPSTYEGDIHCVTTWSKLGTSFSGVSLDVLLDEVGVSDDATHVVAWSSTGYTTNLPLADVTDGKAWIVWDHEGSPLPTEHGGPVRLLVPHLYFWKSAKWVAGLRVLDHDEPASGRSTATTTAATPGPSSGMPGTEPSPDDLPPLPTLGPVSRRPPTGGARRVWMQATLLSVHDETPRMKSFRLKLP
jgi:DMSO/TMAO reductase YedYZ molybdopterin-dependent catalytic subunit